MDTRKLIPVEQLQYSSIFMGELYRKMSYLPETSERIDSYFNKSKTIYFVLNQKLWKDNDCSFFLQMSDGKEHQRMEMEQPIHMNIECWRFAIEVHYRKNDKNESEVVVKPTKIFISRVSQLDKEFVHTSCEGEYLEKIEQERKAMEDANNLIKKS